MHNHAAFAYYVHDFQISLSSLCTFVLISLSMYVPSNLTRSHVLKIIFDALFLKTFID